MTAEFTARVRLVSDVAVVELVGELDVGTVHRLQDRLDGVAAQMAGDVIVDCAELDFVGSSGLNVLALAHNRLVAAGRRLWIHAPSASLQRLLTITGLDSALPQVDVLPGEDLSRSRRVAQSRQA